MIARSFGPGVEKYGGAESAASSSNPKTQLVETKLAMVCPAWMSQHSRVIYRFCWLGRVDRVQRDEID
jgi:hypothetical protein